MSIGWIHRVVAVVVALSGIALLPGCRADTARTTTPADAAELSTRAQVLAASDLPDTVAQPLAGDPMGMTVHRLRNGMTVYLATDRQEPSFFGWIAVRAGSRHDPGHATGLAHYLEHMLLFKGSDELGTIDHAQEQPHLKRIRELYRELATVPDSERDAVLKQIDAQTQSVAKLAIPNEISRLYTAQGFTQINAFTNKDRTYYVQRVPANRRETWASVEAERFGDPVFRLFFPELEAVYEEKNRGIDSAGRTMFVQTTQGLFPKHPYGTQTTLGTIEHLKTPAFDEMIAFYERWYVPNNMAIILAGDVDASILPLLEDKFSKLEPKALPEPPPGALPAVKGRVFKEFFAKGEHVVRVAWKTVPAAHSDEPVFEVIDRLLDDAPSGLLRLELTLPQRVHWAGSSTTHYREAGFLIAQAGPRLGQSHAEVEALLRETVGHLRNVSDSDVEAAKLQASIARKRLANFPAATASAALDAFVQHRQWVDVVERKQRLQAVTLSRVIEVAERYLGSNSVVVYQHDGEPQLERVTKPEVTALALDPSRKSKMAAGLEALPVTALEPQWLVEGQQYSRLELPGGTLPAGLMVAAPNARSDLFRIEYRFDRGARKAPLLCAALRLVDRAGTPQLPPAQVKQALYRLGASIQARCDVERAYVIVTGIDRNLEPTLALLDALFSAPQLEEALVNDAIHAMLERRRNALREEGTLSDALREFAFKAEGSPYLAWPSNKRLAAATPKQLRALITSLFAYQHRTLYYGPRTADTAATLVPRGHDTKATGALPPRVFRKVLTTRIFFLDRKQAKASVRVGFASTVRSLDQVPEAQVLSHYLGGGIGSVVFREIRSARGLAYSAFAGVSIGHPGDESWLWAAMQNQGDKVAQAVPALLQVLRKREIAAMGFGQSRSALDANYRASRVNPLFVTAAVDAMHRDGFSQDPGPTRWQHLQTIQKGDLEQFAEELTRGPAIIAIIGDREQVDLDALASIGPVTVVQPEQLFAYGPFD